MAFEALSYEDDTRHFTPDVSKERLASAPKYRKDTDLSDRKGAEEVYRFYGITPRWEEGMEKGRPPGLQPGRGAGDPGVELQDMIKERRKRNV